VRSLKAYVAGLKTTPPTSKPINRRNVELIKLFQAWTDLLGGAHANLFKRTEEDGSDVPMWRNDDHFYDAQGVAHVIHHLIQAVAREYEGEFKNRSVVIELVADITDTLGRAATLKPVIVLDSSPASIFANHRRNLGGYIVDARQKMYSIREELEK
jgi:hypothetical protein